MKYKKAIVILAYNRPDALNNLLNSLNKIKCEENIPLIISIDNNGTDRVNQIAQEFNWKFGSKEVVIHRKRLGLKAQFMLSGDYTEKYENIIFLEDDLLVSPYIVDFCNSYLENYLDDDRIAGASLYNPILKEGTGCKFFQIEDGSDVYFLQQPYWGNVWSNRKWKLFREWLTGYKFRPELLPKHIAEWRDTSFKKLYVQYLIETNRFFVTPRLSVLTNNGEAGVHNTISKYQYQCNIQCGSKEYRMIKLNDSLSIYDAYFEILPTVIKKMNPALESFDFYVDIYQQKPLLNKYEYCITTRKCKNAIHQFNSEMKPKELGAALNTNGCGLYLAKTEDILWDSVDRSVLLAKDMIDNYMIDFNAAISIVRWKIKDKFCQGKKK